jgi:hypothetical protein
MDNLQKADHGQNKYENAKKEKPGFCIINQVDPLEIVNECEWNGKEEEKPSVLYFILPVKPVKKQRRQNGRIQ